MADFIGFFVIGAPEGIRTPRQKLLKTQLFQCFQIAQPADLLVGLLVAISSNFRVCSTTSLSPPLQHAGPAGPSLAAPRLPTPLSQ